MYWCFVFFLIADNLGDVMQARSKLYKPLIPYNVVYNNIIKWYHSHELTIVDKSVIKTF